MTAFENLLGYHLKIIEDFIEASNGYFEDVENLSSYIVIKESPSKSNFIKTKLYVDAIGLSKIGNLPFLKEIALRNKEERPKPNLVSLNVYRSTMRLISQMQPIKAKPKKTYLMYDHTSKLFKIGRSSNPKVREKTTYQIHES